MQEIWKDIPGYEGKYQISNLGNVLSLHFKRSSTNSQLLKPRIDHNGYSRVYLRKPGERKVFFIHRLVAIAFIPNPQNKPFVNHINSNRSDNRAENLEWCTQQENIKHGYLYGNVKPPTFIKGRTGAKCPTSKPVLQISLSDNSVIQEFPGMNEAHRITGFYTSGICECCKGKIKSYKGYIWRYKDE